MVLKQGEWPEILRKLGGPAAKARRRQDRTATQAIVNADALSGLESGIAGLDGRLDTAEADIVALEAAAGIEEAAVDGRFYARKDADWAEINSIGGISTAEYTYSATTTPPPSTGQLRGNSGTQSAITSFYLHETNAVGIDITNALKLIAAGVKILVQDKTNSANVQYYQTTGPAVDNGVYFTIPVIWTATGSGSAFTAGRVIFAGFGIGTNQAQSIVIAASDETTALTAAADKVKFRMPYAFTLTAVRASLSTAQASGSIFTVDINEAGTTVLSTKITIDNTEKTSTTAATPAVISDASLADDAEVSIDIDAIGDGTAKGLKVTLIGSKT